jgi:hypothetical protein
VLQESALCHGTTTELKERILAPAKLKAGHDPNWASDALHATMAPYTFTSSNRMIFSGLDEAAQAALIVSSGVSITLTKSLLLTLR